MLLLKEQTLFLFFMLHHVSLLGLLGFSCLDLGSHARWQVPRVTMLIPKREIHFAHVSQYKELCKASANPSFLYI